MKRITKKVREEAALICAIAASRGDDHTLWSFADVARLLGSSVSASCLAWDAWMACGENYDQGDLARDAEAEALLRFGWSPSDGAP